MEQEFFFAPLSFYEKLFFFDYFLFASFSLNDGLETKNGNLEYRRK